MFNRKLSLLWLLVALLWTASAVADITEDRWYSACVSLFAAGVAAITAKFFSRAQAVSE